MYLHTYTYSTSMFFAYEYAHMCVCRCVCACVWGMSVVVTISVSVSVSISSEKRDIIGFWVSQWRNLKAPHHRSHINIQTSTSIRIQICGSLVKVLSLHVARSFVICCVCLLHCFQHYYRLSSSQSY